MSARVSKSVTRRALGNTGSQRKHIGGDWHRRAPADGVRTLDGAEPPLLISREVAKLNLSVRHSLAA